MKQAHPSHHHVATNLHVSAAAWEIFSVDLVRNHHYLSSRPEETGEAALRVPRHVLGRRRQQRRLQRLLRALVQLAQRRHGAALPASDGGRGRGAEPLRQRQLV